MISADHKLGYIHKTGGKRLKRADRMAGQWADAPYNAAASEEALWRAVITQAMVDAITTNLSKLEFIIDKMEALTWLTSDSEDFLDVCERAGMDYNDVRVRAKKALTNPSAWRAAAGESERYEERKAFRERCRRDRKRRARAEAKAVRTGCLIYNLFA